MAKSGFSIKTVGGKLTLAFVFLSISVCLALAVVSYTSGSESIRIEATNKLAAISELKTQKVDEFLEMRYSEVHIMTGLDTIKNNIDNIISDIEGSQINPQLSIEDKRAAIERISPDYSLAKQYFMKNFKELGAYSEIKLVAAWDIVNSVGQVVIAEGDQLISTGNYSGNTKERSMFKEALVHMRLEKTGITAEETGCPFLYSSSFEHCGELNHSSIHLSHGIGRSSLNLNELNENSPVKDRFSSILIFDVDTVKIEALLNDATGMGETGLSYMVEEIGSDFVVLTTDRFGQMNALDTTVNQSEGIAEHMARNESRRGADFCITREYLNSGGIKVLAHNHILPIGENDIGLITEMESREIFQGASRLLIFIMILSVIVLLIAIVIAVLVSRSLSKPIKYVSSILSTLSTGDLTVAVEKKALSRNDEIGDMTRRVDDLVDKLQGTVSVVLTGSEQIASASTQLASGNQDLSNRTEQQATALEETSSAIEEMNSSIRSNADNTTSADQLAREALGKTGEGAAAVDTMIASMNEISVSSNKIADIIEVINNIAFQTNLLALNASIEAARAGEQGKGFAVVAVEVRKLAKRSDKAATEIAGIIKSSNIKVDEGVHIANKAGEMLSEITQSVKKVTALVGEISAASQEQLSSVDQIDKTLSSLDENTQKNAALVEEAASSTEELSSQAEELNSNMNFFKIDKRSRRILSRRIETPHQSTGVTLANDNFTDLRSPAAVGAIESSETYESFSALADESDFAEF